MKKVINKKDYQSLVKHNNLVKGRYTLEASEQKLLYKLFEHIQKNNYKTKELKIEFVEFYKEFKDVLGKGITKNDFKNLLEKLQEKMPYIIIGDEFVRTQWYRIKGKINFEEVTLILDDDVFLYIQEQEDNFTMLRLESLYSFKKFYSMRLYELLKQWSNKKKVIEFDLEVLKHDLNILDNPGYKNFYNIDTRILKPAVKEINEKSELTIEYSAPKVKNKVQSVIFTIKEQKKINSFPNKPMEKDKIKIAKETIETKEIIFKQENISEMNNIIKNFYIPEYSLLNTASRISFKRDFNQYDFRDEEYKQAFYESEGLTVEKDSLGEYEQIGMASYNWFKATLKNKLDTIDSKRISGNNVTFSSYVAMDLDE